MKNKKVLVIGSGGREHALVWKLAQSPSVKEIFVAPGNAGTAQIATNVDISVNDFDALLEFAKDNSMDLTVIGPDDQLAAGIVDTFRAAGLRVFGPTKAAARIESSKAFSKELMAKQAVATATYKIFDDYETAKSYLEGSVYPIVIKASGLALGKGVVICQDKEEALAALHAAMVDKTFGEAGNEVVIEEYLGNDQEVSIHVITDGKSTLIFPTAQDHKPIFDGDKGPNTGGMGTYAPIPWAGKEYLDWAENKVVDPILAGLVSEDSRFTGCLYPGLKLTQDGPKVLEFNARFGDPETQSYMRLLESDLYEIFEATADGRLSEVRGEWKDGFAACIILASAGYPTAKSAPVPISGLENAEMDPNIVIFHSGTKNDGDILLATGGRVLGVTATGRTLQEAVDTAYKAVGKITFEGMQYRKDIAAKALGGRVPTTILP